MLPAKDAPVHLRLVAGHAVVDCALLFNTVRFERKDSACEPDSNGHQEHQINEADQHVQRVHNEVSALRDAEHHLDGGKVWRASGVNAHCHAGYLRGFFTKVFAEEEKARGGDCQDRYQADNQGDKRLADRPPLEVACEKDERQRQRNGNAGKRILHGIQQLRHAGKRINQQVAGNKPYEI